jgi:hypothetical protein
MVFCSLLQGPPPPSPQKISGRLQKNINAANVWTGDILPGNETAGPREEGSKNIHLRVPIALPPPPYPSHINTASAVYLPLF